MAHMLKYSNLLQAGTPQNAKSQSTNVKVHEKTMFAELNISYKNNRAKPELDIKTNLESHQTITESH